MILAMLALVGAMQDEARAPVRAQSVAPLASLFSDSDYPVDALRRGAEGRVAVRLVIDRAGAPIDCKIATSSGDVALDGTTCAILLQRARFHAARNARGEAVVDTVSTRIRWRLGTNMPPGVSPFSPYRIAMNLSLSTEGELRCSLDVNGVRQPSPGRCPNVAPDILTIASQVDPAFELTLVQSFMPEGGVIASPAIPYGRLLAEAEAEIIIDTRGEVESCRMITGAVHVSEIAAAPDICASPQRPRYLPGAANRRARVGVFLYLGTPVAG